jgi:NADH dehydrogenase
MVNGSVLVVGATGQLGGVIARRLLDGGTPVRALARNAERLAPLQRAGAEVAAVDLLDHRKLGDACKGVRQIISTANNSMGSGATGPGRVDLTAHQNLCAAARNAGVKRLVYVSFRDATPDQTVDIFRIKWYIDDAIRRSGVPYVLLRPSAFVDVWAQIIVDNIRRKGASLIFGDGSAVMNYITVDDVARFAIAILEQEAIVNEAIDVGGPSDVSWNDLAALLERRLGASGRRRQVPLVALKLLPPVVRLFNEAAARRMTLGHYAATRTAPFPGWRTAADRFGIEPKTVEAYVDGLPV